jgi:hypothetical protein
MKQGDIDVCMTVVGLMQSVAVANAGTCCDYLYDAPVPVTVKTQDERRIVRGLRRFRENPLDWWADASSEERCRFTEWFRVTARVADIEVE